jgi:hypothetical protein
VKICGKKAKEVRVLQRPVSNLRGSGNRGAKIRENRAEIDGIRARGREEGKE